MENTMVYWRYIGRIEKNGNYYGIWGLYRESGKDNGSTTVNWGYTERVEKSMVTTMVHWCYIGRMEKKMETTIVYWGGYRENGKENGN